MARVPPFHSRRPNDRNIHHENNRCTEGKASNRQLRPWSRRPSRSPSMRRVGLICEVDRPRGI